MSKASTAKQATAARSGKSLVTVTLTALFVLLYVLSLLGIIDKAADTSLADRLEPILFAIVGYYFARTPSREAEKRMVQQTAEERKDRQRAQLDSQRVQANAADAEARMRASRKLLEASLDEATGFSVDRGTATPQFRSVLAALEVLR